MNPTKTAIGTNRVSYTQTRNFAGLPFEKYRFERVRDLFLLLRRLTRRETFFLRESFCDFGLNKVPVMHFFNTVSFSHTPWVVSFTANAPRWYSPSHKPSRYGLGLLARRSCRRVIAISNCAHRIQRAHLQQFPDLQTRIEDKMCVLLPSQRLEVHDLSEKELDPRLITFTLVGHLFFLKGGGEILRVFDRLIQQGAPVKLNIVSKLLYGEWASRSTEKDHAWALEIMGRYTRNISYFPHLSNSEVIQLLRRSHVGLLPSYWDTFGYSALEAQACGCPVITTDTKALPEINNDEVGWVITVPKGRFDSADVSTPEKRTLLSETIENGLHDIIGAILRNPSVVRTKGGKALERIRRDHDPQKAAAFLEGIYDSILEGK